MLEAFDILPGFLGAVPVENGQWNRFHIVSNAESIEDKHHQRKDEDHKDGGTVSLDLDELFACNCPQCRTFHSARCLVMMETKMSSRDGVISRTVLEPSFIRSPIA